MGRKPEKHFREVFPLSISANNINKHRYKEKGILRVVVACAGITELPTLSTATPEHRGKMFSIIAGGTFEIGLGHNPNSGFEADPELLAVLLDAGIVHARWLAPIKALPNIPERPLFFEGRMCFEFQGVQKRGTNGFFNPKKIVASI